MPKFALEIIEAIQGKQVFVKLIVDEICPFDDFENGLQGQYKKELVGIYNNMQNISDLKLLPKEKFHYLDDGEHGVREFEFKSKHLRVYGITKPNGKIIILGGTKANQKGDISEFRRIKLQYLASL